MTAIDDTRRPVYDGAPRPLVPREARMIAGTEYGYRRAGHVLEGGRGWMLLSRGADGGMHHRGEARTDREAIDWVTGKVDQLVERLMAGACTHTCFYDRARDAYYIG